MPSNNTFCQKTGEKVQECCQNASCIYHTSYQNAYNCALVYMGSQEINQLSFKDISILLNIPINKILKNYNLGMKLLREQALIHSNLEPAFTIVLSNNVCVCCEKLIEEGALIQFTDNGKNISYCSKKCVKAYPPNVVELEIKYKNSITSILKWMFHYYKTFDIIKQTLHLDDIILKQWIKKYLGTTAKKILQK